MQTQVTLDSRYQRTLAVADGAADGHISLIDAVAQALDGSLPPAMSTGAGAGGPGHPPLPSRAVVDASPIAPYSRGSSKRGYRPNYPRQYLSNIS